MAKKFAVLQKQSTKTRIETFDTPAIFPTMLLRCKSRLQKQGLKPKESSHYWSHRIHRCKSRLPKQGLKRLLDSLNLLGLPDWLQKPSTKTRIETFLHKSMPINCPGCKSRLRKQGLKQFCITVFF